MRQSEKGRGVSGRVVLLMILVAAAAGPITVLVYLRLAPHSTGSLDMAGSLFINDSGQAKGSSGLSATYNATLSVTAGSGALNLTLIQGSRDLLTQHAFTVTSFVANDTAISMLLDGRPTTLVYVTNDTVWNGQFDEYFVASGSPSAPLSELRGTIVATDFAGLTQDYYVELRLAPVQPPAAIPF